MSLLSVGLLVASLVGLTLLFVQRLAMAAALRAPRALAHRDVGLSVLKPLCGADEQLLENLESFAQQHHARLEVLLGVRDARDAACPIAREAVRRWPDRFKLVFQESVLGANPKVNQLVTLAKHAKYDLLLVSDSNVRLAPEAVSELVGLFEDDMVACVTNPVSGAGHESFGAVLDNLHLASSIGAGQLAAKWLTGRDLVVGKSMAMRKSAVRALGGFEAYVNVLAEDYVIGCDLRARGLQVRVAQTPVMNVAAHRSVGSFWRRYLRWGVIHRTAVSLPTSLAQGLLNPWPLTLIALALEPGHETFFASVTALLAKSLIDCSAARALGCSVDARALFAVAVKDVLIFTCWLRGFFVRTVDWRGTALRVGTGSRLEPRTTGDALASEAA